MIRVRLGDIRDVGRDILVMVSRVRVFAKFRPLRCLAFSGYNDLVTKDRCECFGCRMNRWRVQRNSRSNRGLPLLPKPSRLPEDKQHCDCKRCEGNRRVAAKYRAVRKAA